MANPWKQCQGGGLFHACSGAGASIDRGTKQTLEDDVIQGSVTAPAAV